MSSLVSAPFATATGAQKKARARAPLHSFLLSGRRGQQPGRRAATIRCAVAGNGLFTQTNPDVRRVVPAERGLPRVKVVYVVLEAQYQSSVTAAVLQLNADPRRAAEFEVVGYLVEELRDADTYAAFCDDVAAANVFIGSLIFVEELALKVRDAVAQHRDRMDAVLVFPSMPEVMRLNKLGSFSMAQLGQSKSPFFQLFKRNKKDSSGFADSMLKLVRTLPKVLKYLPSDKAQDARLYILSLQFWLGGSPDNLQNFLKMIDPSR